MIIKIRMTNKIDTIETYRKDISREQSIITVNPDYMRDIEERNITKACIEPHLNRINNYTDCFNKIKFAPLNYGKLYP